MADLFVPTDIAHQHAAMVEVALTRGNREQAYAAVDKAFATTAEESSFVPTAQSHISCVVSSVRMCTILESAGISTVGDLCDKTPQELASRNQIRKRSVDMIARDLERYGLALAVVDCG